MQPNNYIKITKISLLTTIISDGLVLSTFIILYTQLNILNIFTAIMLQKKFSNIA